METKIDYNSIENMRIKEKLIARDVVHSCETMIKDLSYTVLQEEILEKFFMEYDEETGNYLEPSEFWIVTDFFAKELKKQNQIVDEFLGFQIWARCTTGQTKGQAIALDHVVSRIAEEMEILEGQQYSWADRK